MKKKLVCAVVALSLALTGCTDTESPVSSESSSAVSSETISAQETVETVPESDSEPLGTPVSAADYFGLSKINLGFTPDSVSEPNDGRVLIAASEESGKTTLGMLYLDSMTLVTNEIEFPTNDYQCYSANTLFLEGRPVVAEMMTGKIYLLNDDLSVADTLELDSSEYYSMYYLDDSRLYFKRYNDSSLTEITLSDGKLTVGSEELNCGENRFVQSVSFLSENDLILCCYEQPSYNISYFLLNKTTGELTLMNISDYDGVFTREDDILVYNYTDNEVTVCSSDTPSLRKVIAFPADSWSLYTVGNAENLYFYSDSNDKATLYRISPETGSLTAKAEVPLSDDDFYFFIGSLSEYGDKVLFLANSDGAASMYMWNPELIPAEEGWAALLTQNYSEMSEDIAQEIESEYGINVLYGNDAVRYFSTYAVVSETNERRIFSSLSAIKSTLSKFPSGFLKELADYNDIEILLTGSILSNGISRDSITTAAAFTSSDWESKKETVVIDINGGNLEMNLAHEFCHVIEDTMFSLSYADYENTYELFARWQLMNPEGFQYANVYTNDDGSTISWYDNYLGMAYYEGGEMQLSDVYFVDGYATTYPKEDRARIFEYMFAMGTDLPAYFASPHLQEKAGYMFLCMRECFETLAECDDIVWEKGLTVQHDMQWYLENYSDWESMAVG